MNESDHVVTRRMFMYSGLLSLLKFHDLSEFSMTYVKAVVLNVLSNYLLFKLFSHIITQTICASVFNFLSFCLFILRTSLLSHDFT